MGPIIEFRNCEFFMTPSPPQNTLAESPNPSPGPRPHVPRLFKVSLNAI